MHTLHRLFLALIIVALFSFPAFSQGLHGIDVTIWTARRIHATTSTNSLTAHGGRTIRFQPP